MVASLGRPGLFGHVQRAIFQHSVPTFRCSLQSASTPGAAAAIACSFQDACNV
jgi:hypothetical protein